MLTTFTGSQTVRQIRSSTNTGGKKQGKRGRERPNREDENQQHDVGTERLHNQQPEIPRRQLPPRTRRLPSRLKDYILDFNNRETEL